MVESKIDRKSAEEVMQWVRKRSKNIENRKMTLMFDYILQQLDNIEDQLAPKKVGRPSKKDTVND